MKCCINTHEITTTTTMPVTKVAAEAWSKHLFIGKPETITLGHYPCQLASLARPTDCSLDGTTSAEAVVESAADSAVASAAKSDTDDCVADLEAALAVVAQQNKLSVATPS